MENVIQNYISHYLLNLAKMTENKFVNRTMIKTWKINLFTNFKIKNFTDFRVSLLLQILEII